MKMFHEFFPGVDPAVISARLETGGITIEYPDMHRFSNVNIVIGPNGSGKTRFLEAVRDLYQDEPSGDVLYCYFPDLSSRKFVKSRKSPLPRFSLKNFLDRDGISFDNFVKAIEEQGENFLMGLLRGESEYEIEENNFRLERMNRFVAAFLGKDLSRSVRRVVGNIPSAQSLVITKASGDKTLGLTTALEKFSPGERILFYMALFLTLKKELRGNIKHCIILDEPETHLHPDALLKFTDALQAEFPGADIWIATHSLFLVPKFKFDNIVYIENSQIARRNSKLYDKLMFGMLGGGNEDVSRFFASRAQWQYYEYLSGCFRIPEVVDTVNPADPQVQKFLRSYNNREIKKVLDFGGGSGRLGRSLEAAHFLKWQDTAYHIIDKDPTLAEAAGFTVFTDLKDADKDYDFIVMMNVLHELEPGEWVSLFHEFREHMSEDAELIIIEMEALRDGECPNETGYILLGEDELAALFSVPNFMDMSENTSEDTQKPKTEGFSLSRNELSQVSNQTVSAAVKGLELRTYQKIKDIRSNKEGPVNAREYAFLLQQYINAKLFNERQEKKWLISPSADQVKADDLL